jgi:hypothetical protein
MTNITMRFSQSAFGIFVSDILYNHNLDYNIFETNNIAQTYEIEIFLNPWLLPSNRTIIQITFNQVHLAGYASLADAFQNLWTFDLNFPVPLPNSRILVQLPPAMQYTNILERPISAGVNEAYLDTDNRWVVLWGAGTLPSNDSLIIQYQPSLKLWGYALAPLAMFGCVFYVNRILNGEAAQHALACADTAGAHDLWQMGFSMHLAFLAVVVASWGLLIGQESIFPSTIDLAVGIIVFVALFYFIRDSSWKARFVRVVRKKEMLEKKMLGKTNPSLASQV